MSRKIINQLGLQAGSGSLGVSNLFLLQTVLSHFGGEQLNPEFTGNSIDNSDFGVALTLGDTSALAPPAAKNTDPHPSTVILTKLGPDVDIDGWSTVFALLEILRDNDTRPPMLGNPVDDVVARVIESGVQSDSLALIDIRQRLAELQEFYALNPIEFTPPMVNVILNEPPVDSPTFTSDVGISTVDGDPRPDFENFPFTPDAAGLHDITLAATGIEGDISLSILNETFSIFVLQPTANENTVTSDTPSMTYRVNLGAFPHTLSVTGFPDSSTDGFTLDIQPV